MENQLFLNFIPQRSSLKLVGFQELPQGPWFGGAFSNGDGQGCSGEMKLGFARGRDTEGNLDFPSLQGCWGEMKFGFSMSRDAEGKFGFARGRDAEEKLGFAMGRDTEGKLGFAQSAGMLRGN